MGIKRPKDEPFKKQKDNRKTTERLMNHRQIKTLAFLSTLLASLQAQGQLLQTPPKLVITIAIDQLRTDYLEAFTPLYGDKGFRLLMNEGLVYTNASYSFANIDRASSIANISTGTTPYYNSIVGARWLDRETLRPVYCVEDGKYPGIQTNDKSSPQKLSTSTIGDELKVATAGKALVYSIAPFREAAVLGAGHAADGALWIDDNNGSWCSSQYYTQGGKKWMKEIDKMQSPNSFVDHLEWEPINQVSGSFSYFMSGGPQKPFKHKFTSIRKYREYKTSALVNTHITDMALKCIDGNEMGADGISDMLNLTYYAGTFDHRSITECGMELQDTYVRLDKALARLIETVERKVGAGNALFVLTSTGYTDEEDGDRDHCPPEIRAPCRCKRLRRHAGLVRRTHQARDKAARAGRDHKTDTETRLEDARAASADLRRQRLRQVHRHRDGHVTGAHALQDTANEQHGEVRKRQADDRYRRQEHRSRKDDGPLASDPIAEHSGREGRKKPANEHRADDQAHLRAGIDVKRHQVRLRRGNDTEVYAV